MIEAAPRGRRLARPSWLDARLLLGVLLVLVAVVLGARVFASADDEVSVWTAAHPLVAGERVAASDLTPGRVRLDGQASLYLAATGEPPVGYVVRRYVGAGELLPRAALVAPSAATDDRLVALPVQPGHLPPGIGPGQLVDVYLTPTPSGGAATGTPRLVAHDLAVEQEAGSAGALSGTATLSLVVAVPAAETAAVVRAAESGHIDVVGVPPSVAGGVTAASSAGP